MTAELERTPAPDGSHATSVTGPPHLDENAPADLATVTSLIAAVIARLREDATTGDRPGTPPPAAFPAALRDRLAHLIYGEGAHDGPFLSVILVVDDVPEVMWRDALLALDAQGDPDFELLVVSSSPTTSDSRILEVLSEFSSDLAGRSRVASTTDATPRGALRAGFAAARGRYVTGLDASSVTFAHFVETFHRLAQESPAALLRARALAQPLRPLRWPDESPGFEPTAGAAPASAPRFSFVEHLAGSPDPSPLGSYALRRDYVELLGPDEGETMPVAAALLGGVGEASDEVVVLLRPFAYPLSPSSSALLEHLSTYLHKVDPRLTVPVVVTTSAPDYAALSRASFAVVVGERSEAFLHDLSERTRLHRAFAGAIDVRADGTDVVPVTLFDRWDPTGVASRPASFRVWVVVTTYNEADVIEQLLERLRSPGVHVHVIDNWSDDATPRILADAAQRSDVTWERFPASGDTGHFELEKLLGRVEEVAADCGADWVIHHDADEIRESPWPGVSLIDALWAIEQWGYNGIDHTVVNFRPVEDSWSSGDDLATSFPWCEFGDTPADFLQIKGWKPQGRRLTMAANAGHQVQFEGRRVFPYKFLLRHYSIRSQAHGERKVLRERQPRWSEEERAKGWHVHYDHYENGTSFLWSREGLRRWDQIDQGFLLARLSGVGLAGNPWPGEGPVDDA